MRALKSLVPSLLVAAACCVPLAARQADGVSPGEARHVATLVDPSSGRDDREASAYWIRRERYASTQTIEALIRVVADPTLGATSREVVGHALGALAERDAALAGRLVALSTDADANRRWALSVALRHVADRDDAAFAALLARLDDDDAQVRARAVTSLGMVRRPFPADWPHAKALVLKWWEHADPVVRGHGWSLLPTVLGAHEWLRIVVERYLRGELEWEQALGAARRVGPAGTEMFADGLIASLEDDDPSVRDRAALHVADLGVGAEGAIAILVRRLDEGAPASRAIVARALGGFGAAASDAVQRLVDVAIQEPDATVRLAALDAIAAIDGAAPTAQDAFRFALDDVDARLRCAATGHLIRSLDEDQITEVMRVIDASPHPDVRRAAVLGLSWRWHRAQGGGSRGAIIESWIVAALGDSDATVQQAAAESIEAMKLATPAAIAALESLLHREQPEVRVAAVRALHAAGPRAQSTVPQLVALLDDASTGVRDASAAALAVVGAGRGDVAEAIIRRIEARAPGGNPREGALLSALAAIGPVTDRVVPTLVASLDDPDVGDRCAAIKALGSIGPGIDGVIASLARVRADPEPPVRQAALETLGPWSATSEPATRALVGFFGDNDAGLRRMACGWCGADARGDLAGPGGLVALPELAALLVNDPDNHVRRAAIRAIVRNGPTDPAVRATLIAALGDEWSEVRLSAAVALGRAGPHAAEATEALAACLRDRNEGVAVAAAMALGAIGPSAATALPALREALARSEPTVRQAAQAAIVALTQAQRQPSR